MLDDVIVIGDVHQCSPMFKLLLDVHRCSPVFFNGELASASWSVGELTVIHNDNQVNQKIICSIITITLTVTETEIRANKQI